MNLFRLILSFFQFGLRGGGIDITAHMIHVYQNGDWIAIPRDKISAVKNRSLSRVIVRLNNGPRYVVARARSQR